MMRAIGITTLGALSIVLAGQAAGLMANLSESAPTGLWILRPAASIDRGMLVSVCPPDVPITQKTLPCCGCPNTNLKSILKAVGAVSGDSVVLRHGYPAKVNGIDLPNTIASPTVPAWPDGEYTVGPNQVWVFSTYSDKSLDSRYLGPIEITSIQAEAKPLLIAGNVADMTRGIRHD